jgi:NADH-quinone oxidoreductase subunit K
MNASPTTILLAGVLGLLGVGFYGLMASRNLIKVVVTLNLSQSLAITVIVADTIVAVIGMALAVQIRRQLGTLDIQELSKLRG